jgi:Flp pilus assembly protein TadG
MTTPRGEPGATRRPVWPCRWVSDLSGTTALEFVLIAPVLFTLVFGGIEFGRLIWTQSALNYSVQSGLRCWTLGVCATGSAAKAVAVAAAPQLGFTTSTFTATSGASCGCKMSASYSYTFLVSGLLPANPTLSAQACMPYVTSGSNQTCQP